MIGDVVTSVLLLAGAALTLISGIGVVRMPDLYTRMSAASKASTLGAGLVLAAVAVHSRDASVTARALAAIAFLFLTIPVGAHYIARAAHKSGIPLWKDSVDDALARAESEAARENADASTDRRNAY